MDFLAVGPVINGIAAVLVLDTSRSRTVRVPGHLAALAWAACLVVGVEALSREAVLLAAPNRRAWTNAYTPTSGSWPTTPTWRGSAGCSFGECPGSMQGLLLSTG
jgi:hypothetical protein